MFYSHKHCGFSPDHSPLAWHIRVMTLGLSLWQLVVQEYVATALNDVSAYVT